VTWVCQSSQVLQVSLNSQVYHNLPNSWWGGRETKLPEEFELPEKRTVTRVIESVDHKHEQCCYVPGTALPTWTLGLGTEALVSR